MYLYMDLLIHAFISIFCIYSSIWLFLKFIYSCIWIYDMAIANQVYLNRGKQSRLESSAGDRVHGDDLWLKAGSFGKLAEPERWRLR